MHNHVLQYIKHNGIIIPTLFLTLEAKIQYGCRYKGNIINNIKMWYNWSICRGGLPLQLYSIIAYQPPLDIWLKDRDVASEKEVL